MKNFKNIFLSLLALTVLFSCDHETAKIDSEEPGGLSYKPTATIETSVPNGNVEEGTTIEHAITFSKPIPYSVDFHAVWTGGTASPDDDIELGSVRIAAYSTSATLTVNVVSDGVPENDETAMYIIEPSDPASSYYVHPNSNLGEYNYTIKSAVDPDDLIVAFFWDEDKSHDMDMFVFSEEYGDWDVQATGDIPEIKNMVWGSDPDGTYYIGVDPYDVEAGVEMIDYRFHFGQPDGTVDIIEGTFDYLNRDSVYDTDVWDAFGTTVYLLFQVEKTGTSFTVTAL